MAGAEFIPEQVAQVHVRMALLNHFTQPGHPTTVPVVAMAQLRLGLVSSRSAFNLCNKAMPQDNFEPYCTLPYICDTTGAGGCPGPSRHT